ncbi:MAG: GDSL-type esterase/lipase family protein, partial [Acidimicrobiales bacterium]
GATAVVALTAPGLASPPDPARGGVPAGGSVAYGALGDSVASGHGLGTNGLALEADAAFGQPRANCQRSAGTSAADKAYPDLLRDELAARPDTEVRFSKLACTGHTTADLLEYQLPPAERLLGPGPGVVTITIGANDYHFSDPVTYLAALNPSQRVYDIWRARIEATVRANLATALTRLGRGRPQLRVLVTHYYNPFNADSAVFAVVPGCRRPQAGGGLDCAGRVAAAIEGLNQTIGEAVTAYRSERGVDWATVALTGGVGEAFAGHEAPRPNCGSAAPDTGQSWIQSPPHPLLVEALIGEQRLGTGGDCFHPSAVGHQVLARLVLASLTE